MNGFKSIDKSEKGFNLVELMIVVAIVGILTAVALPNYTIYVTRSARGDAIEQLNEIMAQQQTYVLRQRTYTTNLVTNLGYIASPEGVQVVRTDNGLYDIFASVCGVDVSLTRCVSLTAVPVDDKRQAADGRLTLNSRGQKSHRGRTGWYHND